MAPGALDALTKELIYVAVSTTNNCGYCIATHTASAQKKGMTEAMFAELMAVIGMANETNNLATGYQVEIDDQFNERGRNRTYNLLRIFHEFADEHRRLRSIAARLNRAPSPSLDSHVLGLLTESTTRFLG